MIVHNDSITNAYVLTQGVQWSVGGGPHPLGQGLPARVLCQQHLHAQRLVW